MSTATFFDTNVLVYRFDFSEPGKRAIAHQLLDEAIAGGTAALSTQSLQEFYNVATRKFKMPAAIAKGFASAFSRANVVQVTPPLIFAAMDRHAGGGFSFWDALIVETALDAGADVLYSEDMTDGLVIDRLTIRNPFLAAIS